MVRKKVEGDEEQRRAAAREAARAGESPSAAGVTTGASKQRTHVANHGHGHPGHEAKQAAQHRGKAHWREGDLAEAELVDTAATEPERDYTGRGHPPYDTRHERVFEALASAEEENDGRAVTLQDVSRSAELPQDEVRTLLHDLVAVHNLASQIQDSSAGDLYETAPRR